MARKERNDVDYFPHKVNHGRKMFYLRSKYKNDGYTVWFMLLEHLGQSEYHYLDLSDNIQMMYLSSDFMVAEEVLISIVNILVDFDEFDRDLWLNYSIIYGDKFVDSVSDAYKKRNNSCIDKKSLLVLLNAKGILNRPKSNPNDRLEELKVSGSTQTILYYSKVKDIVLLNSNTFVELKLDVSDDVISDEPPKQLTPKEPSFSARCKTFIEKFNEIRGSKFKPSEKVERSLKSRLKNYEPRDIIKALKNAMTDQYHVDNNFKYLTPEFILRQDKLEYFLNLPSVAVVQTQTQTFINHQDR